MMLKGQTTFPRACVDYLKICPSEKRGFISLKEYYDSIRSKNPKITFTSDNLSRCKFKYRGDILKFHELENRQVIALALPQLFDTVAMKKSVFGCVNSKSGRTLNLLETLDRYLEKARYELFQASTILDVDYLNSSIFDATYKSKYRQRCFYAENSIYSYYSIYEIVMLIIYVSLNDCGSLSFDDIAQKCKSTRLRIALKNSNDCLYKEVASEKNGKTIINTKFEKVTEWCNSFKHRGILRFEGEKRLNKPQSLFIPINTSTDRASSSSSDWEFSYVDLDTEVIPALIQYHKDIVALAEKVIEHYHIKELSIL